MKIKGLAEFMAQASNLREEVDKKREWYEEQSIAWQESDKGQDAYVLLDQLEDALLAVENIEYES